MFGLEQGVVLENQLKCQQFLIDCWIVGVGRVKGETSVRHALRQSGPESIDNLLAIGKAASSMYMGAVPTLHPKSRALIVSKYGHVDAHIAETPQIEIIEAAHPVPDKNSLAAGRRVLTFIETVPQAENLVMLVSGGASALVELLPQSISLQCLIEITEKLLSRGYDINSINAIRTKISWIKGGKLLNCCKAREIYSYAISDVPNDDLSVIGSGIGSVSKFSDNNPDLDMPEEFANTMGLDFSVQTERWSPLYGKYFGNIIASNTLARDAAASFAGKMGYEVVVNEESLYEDINAVERNIYATLADGKPGVYIWGGEPTVILPRNPGKGGRNQHLALKLAKRLQGRDDIFLLAAGSDGTDGLTNAAGGMVNGNTFNAVPGGEAALIHADSNTFLARCGGLFVSGPTGTNVMDLVIAVKLQNDIVRRKQGAGSITCPNNYIL